MGADLRHDALEDVGGHGLINRQDDHGMLARLLAAHLHATDVDVGLTEDAPHRADDTGTIVVAEEDHVLTNRHVNIEAVDLDKLGDILRPGHGASHAHPCAIAEGEPHAHEIAVVITVLVRGQRDLDAALLREHRSIDVGDRVVDQALDEALERPEFQHAHV